MYELTVYYDLYQGDKLVWRDDEIEEIANAKFVSSGCGTECGVRDVQLEFDSGAKLLFAKRSLQEAGFRFGAFCPVHEEDDDG